MSALSGHKDVETLVVVALYRGRLRGCEAARLGGTLPAYKIRILSILLQELLSMEKKFSGRCSLLSCFIRSSGTECQVIADSLLSHRFDIKVASVPLKANANTADTRVPYSLHPSM